MLAVPGRPGGLAGGFAGGGQTLVGAGLLVAVADPAGQGERGGVTGMGLAGLAGGQQGLAGAAERVGFSERGGLSDRLRSWWLCGRCACSAGPRRLPIPDTARLPVPWEP